MKTLILENPGRLIAGQTPHPGMPGPGEVLLRVRHVGVCGTDIHAYHGRQPFFEYPRILGHELGVQVEATGEGVEHLKPGQACAVEPYLAGPGDPAFRRGKTNCSASTRCLGVHVDGGMREWIILPANKVHPSSRLGTRELALVEMLGIGHHAVERAALVGDELCAVVGCGPIGLTVLQFCLLAGVPVVAVDIATERLKAVQVLFPGVQTLKVSPDAGLLSSWNASVGERPEVVFDCTGNRASMEGSISLPCNGGTVVLVGIYSGDIAFNGPDFHRRELSILSSRNARAANMRAIIQHMEEGRICPAQWITHECGMDAFPEEISQWLAPGSGLLKGVIQL